MLFNKELMETKSQLILSLQESEDWMTFLEEVEKVVLAELKEHKGAKWYIVLFEIIMNTAINCSDELVAAITGSANIPAEWKAAPKSDWIKFAIENLLDQGKIFIDAFKPSEPPV